MPSTFLADHANCERKASALAMGMVAKYPDRPAILPGLINVAREELEHFEAVYKVMCHRGIALSRDAQDPYVNQLIDEMRHGRDERLLDRLVVAALVEMRGAERFGLIANALEDPTSNPFTNDFTNLSASTDTYLCISPGSVLMTTRFSRAPTILPRWRVKSCRGPNTTGVALASSRTNDHRLPRQLERIPATALNQVVVNWDVYPRLEALKTLLSEAIEEAKCFVFRCLPFPYRSPGPRACG